MRSQKMSSEAGSTMYHMLRKTRERHTEWPVATDDDGMPQSGIFLF